MQHRIADFLIALQEGLLANQFVKLTLSQYHGAEELKTIDVRRVVVKRQDKLSFTYHYKTRDIVKNYEFGESIALIQKLLAEFHTASLYTTEFDLKLDKAGLKKSAPTQKAVPDASHDRAKQRFVAEDRPYLQALKIADAKGQVFKNAQDKFRQINKYVEVMSGLIKQLPPKDRLKIVDMGSGKGYLTFALYDYVTHQLGLAVEMVGVEFRADMVALCNDIAENAGFKGLHFVQSSIMDYDCADADIVIALHACDTATDDALFKAIRAESALIVVAPCCHKQIRREIEQGKRHNDLDFVTRHGTFLERQAEMVTDAMRAQLLEYEGYHTKLFEFISDAHTPKNVMIVASKSVGKAKHDAKIGESIRAAREYFGIGHHHLARLLGYR